MLYKKDIGLPFYDPIKQGRIWVLKYELEFSYYGSIQYSDDYGDSWNHWVDIPPYANYSTLTMDSSGNFYFAQSTGLYKVNGITKIITKAITWNIAYNPHNWFSWTWGEDANENLYTSAYTLTGTGGQFIWKFDGNNWNRIDLFSEDFPTQRHIHSIHVNPFNNNIYISWGDEISARGIAVSQDQLQTYTVINELDTPGPTGLTFTKEAVWITTDIVGSTNYLKSITDNANAVKRWTVPEPYRIAPLYFARAINDNEIWILAYNELGSINTRTALFKLTKNSGVDQPWEAKKIIVGDDKGLNGNSYFQIGCGLNGVIPESSPYIFVERIGKKGLYRFMRN